jgi:uncharacterized protein with HEPN domain/predicted nucleotidyltransferase
MTKGDHIEFPKERIEEFCKRHYIRKLSLFGSALRDDFTPESDLDILVEFDTAHIPGLIRLAGMEIELTVAISEMRSLTRLRCNMRKDDSIRLHHMLDAAKEAESFSQNKTRSSLDTDRKLALALVKCIEIIGEAGTKISNQSREDLPQIPWPNIIGMRNRLIHAYFDINLDILWKTVIEDLPPLISKLEEIIKA